MTFAHAAASAGRTRPSRGRPLVRLLAMLVAAFALPAMAGELPALPVSSERIVEAAVGSGLLDGGDFEAIDDPHVGPLLVGRPADPDAFGGAVSVIIFRGDDGPSQVQVIMAPPWEGLVERIELSAAIAGELVSVPSVLPPMPPIEAGARPMSPMGSWLYGLLYEAWLGWPGSERRLVRSRDGIAVIAEGVPPDLWSLTLVVDRGWPDATWPGARPDSDPPGVAEARARIRAGDYQGARDLLEPLAGDGEPRAALLMGDMYRFGRLDQPDMLTATDWYLVAAQHRHPTAIWSIAAMKTEGWGSFFISNLKAPLLVWAAESGSADALHLLSGTRPGVNYVRPQGVTAADQALQAARWGLLAAQHDVARRHAEGNGVEADGIEAYAWALAALGNTGPGLDYLRSRQIAGDYASTLDAAGIAAATARAAELVTGPPPWPPGAATVPEPDRE